MLGQRHHVILLAACAWVAATCTPRVAPKQPPRSVAVDVDNPLRPQRMLALLDYVDGLFAERYAPATYKRKLLGWDRRAEIARLREAVRRDPSMTAAAFRHLLRRLFRSPRDIHTSVLFQDANGGAWLGIHLKKTGREYVVAWIDRERLSRQVFPFAVGDRVVRFGDTSVEEAIARTKATTGWASTPLFEQSFAEWFLTFRAESDWEQTPPPGTSIPLVIVPHGERASRRVVLKWLDIETSSPSSRCPFWGKTVRGYVPRLGDAIWEAAKPRFYPAYAFALGERRVGAIRVSTYNIASAADRTAALQELDRVVRELKARQVDLLVIDQTGNAGGNFLFGYSLLSRFIDKPLRTPRQHFVITERGVVLGVDHISRLIGLRRALSPLNSDADARRFFSKHPLFTGPLNFMPRNQDTARSLVKFVDFFVERWRPGAGRVYTEPHYQLLEWVFPHRDAARRLVVPILLLVDELNLSAAEYVAATLKDNQRATLMGSTTAGAGGDQRGVFVDSVCGDQARFEHPGCVPKAIAALMKELGISAMQLTVSLGVRVDREGRPLGMFENVGVSPDIAYRISKADLRSGFLPMREAIRNALNALTSDTRSPSRRYGSISSRGSSMRGTRTPRARQ